MQSVLMQILSRRGCTTSYKKINSLYFIKTKSRFAKASVKSTCQMYCIQTRSLSSNSSGTTLHKIFFVDAASPPAEGSDHIPVSETLSFPATDTIPTDENALSDAVEYIPPPPAPPPEMLEEPLQILNSIGEPTFQSLGLASWSPVGIILNGLEYFHVDLGLPWWGSIALATVIIRTLVFPLVIKSQHNTAILANHSPGIKRLQVKMTEARNSGNEMEAARVAFELQKYMKKHNIRPFRSAMMPLIQAPIFISMFIGLRRCANLPVESFKEGGMFWFTDLTVSDPYFILPVITSVTMLATIELGTEGNKIAKEGSPLVKYGLRAMPIIVFPFILHFPAAVLCYWVSTNFFSLIQVGFLRIPAVRQFFKIAPIIKHPEEPSSSKKGFIESAKDSWSNMKVVTDVSERERIDRIAFQKSGSGPLVKTYKHNPLKTKPINVKAKIKDQ